MIFTAQTMNFCGPSMRPLGVLIARTMANTMDDTAAKKATFRAPVPMDPEPTLDAGEDGGRTTRSSSSCDHIIKSCTSSTSSTLVLELDADANCFSSSFDATASN